MCTYFVFNGFKSELFNIKEREATHVLCTQPVSAIIEINIIPLLRIIVLILSLYLTFVKERPRPEIIL
jgi:hypothetical protein